VKPGARFRARQDDFMRKALLRASRRGRGDPLGAGLVIGWLIWG
jgi:hypothetical protein